MTKAWFMLIFFYYFLATWPTRGAAGANALKSFTDFLGFVRSRAQDSGEFTLKD